jgi:hypothetical protein
VIEEMGHAKEASAGDFVKFDDADFGEFLDKGIDDVGGVFVVGWEDLGLDAARVVGSSAHIVQEGQQTEEEIASVDGTLDQFLVTEEFWFVSSVSSHSNAFECEFEN